MVFWQKFDPDKISKVGIERELMADANNVDAWEAPITVPPSSSSRPEWYGNKIPIGITLADRCNEVDAQEVYHFVAEEVSGATAYEFKPKGISAAAIDLYLVPGAVASVTSIANVLWMAYDRFIASKSPQVGDSACLYIIVPGGDGPVTVTLGDRVSTRQALVEQLEAIVADAKKPELRLGHAAKIRELEESDCWVRIGGTGNDL
ncbi:MAG TPA: hypothetical protein VN476_04970 [Pyrinomonadaceae bacterium]|nr:hypothetical protein [Pyrinomonadaceae bacterium]